MICRLPHGRAHCVRQWASVGRTVPDVHVSSARMCRAHAESPLDPAQAAAAAVNPYDNYCSATSTKLLRRSLLAGISLASAWPLCVLEPALAEEAAGSGLDESGAGMTGTSDGGMDTSVDTTITDQVYLDVGLCMTAYKRAEDRTLGAKSIIPEDSEPLGRIVIGVYGKQVPGTVSNFLTAVRSGALTGTTFSRVLPGEYVQAGKQGTFRMGEMAAPPGLKSNPDLSASRAFRLSHGRPGTVSLSLSECDEDPGVQSRPGHHSVEFLITTGPGPVPRLDGTNIVFGRVLSGMSTVAAMTTVPTFHPTGKSDALNRFAAAIGDDRADKVRRKYGRPLRALVITSSGVLSEGNDGAGGTAATA